jgi:hypothetical protein
MPTPEHAEEVTKLFECRYSVSSKSSIASALTHWDTVRDKYMWGRLIHTGDPARGAKLATFVLFLMALPALHPGSTIANYVWALCAHMQLNLQADPRVNVIGWIFFSTAVQVLCYVPGEPRKRVPTARIRDALAAVDVTDFSQVQTALLVLFLYFTFQRSELPCPKTYDGMDPLKHLYVRHMEPYQGGSRWAVGTTKADPRAERLSADAGPGREWIVVGVVDDELFDMRIWLSLFYGLLPPGPRGPDTPFFVARDQVRPLLYHTALADFRKFLGDETFGLHGVRSEAFVTCSGAVSEEAAVIQGGWSSRQSASRYDRLTLAVGLSIASKMVNFHALGGRVTVDDPDALSDVSGSVSEPLRSAGDLGVVAARAAARKLVGTTRAPKAKAARPTHQPEGLPPGWSRVWHPTNGRDGGYADFRGPGGLTARSLLAARRRALEAPPPPQGRPPLDTAVVEPAAREALMDLADLVVYDSRPSARRPPCARG